MNRQPILILGTGALATLFAARLSASGYSITVLGTWPAGLSALRQNSARLTGAGGNEHAFPVYATDDPNECRGAKYAIVLVKAWQTERAACQLAECLAEDGLALTLQNGLGNREILSKYLDKQITAENTEIAEERKNKKNPVNSVVNRISRVALGTTTTGATLLGPGLVKAGGEGKISIEAHPAIGPLEEALRAAKFKVEILQDAQSLIWGKLVINAAINPLTALLKVTNGELLQRPAARGLMHALAEEAASVASAEKVTLPFSDPSEAVEDVARRTAGNHSSMLQDIWRGAPTEIDAICGAVARLGKRHHTPTPINTTFWQLILAMTETE
jgi:2-dehydropantoate 2-reductase